MKHFFERRRRLCVALAAVSVLLLGAAGTAQLAGAFDWRARPSGEIDSDLQLAEQAQGAIGIQLNLKCNGKDPTSSAYVGSSRDDVLVGTSADEVFNGMGGRDHISGGGGNDTICGGSGDDYLEGREGDDWIDGGGDNDWLEGGKGTDIIFGGNGNDLMCGMHCSNGEIYLDESSDTLYGGAGDDQMYRDEAETSLDSAPKTFYGGDGNDFVHGLNRDTVDAGVGTDRCEAQNDIFQEDVDTGTGGFHSPTPISCEPWSSEYLYGQWPYFTNWTWSVWRYPTPNFCPSYDGPDVLSFKSPPVICEP